MTPTYLITNLIQEETLMKSVNITIDNPSILYVGKNLNKSKNIFENGNTLNENSFNKFSWSIKKEKGQIFYCKKP